MWYFEGLKELRVFGSVASIVFCVCLLSLGFIGLAVVVSEKCRYERDKLVRFECGFDPIRRSRIPFSLRFFLLALLFLVFDLEIILLFPYIIRVRSCFIQISIYSKLLGFLFLIILVLGLVHELNEGTLDWEIDD